MCSILIGLLTGIFFSAFIGGLSLIFGLGLQDDLNVGLIFLFAGIGGVVSVWINRVARYLSR